MRICLRRRDFIAGLGGAAAWPLTASAQQGDRVRRIGWLMPGDENDPVGKLRLSAFMQAFADLGWTDGRNVRMDFRWGGGDNNRTRALAQELVGLQPDIIATSTIAPTVAVQRERRGRSRSSFWPGPTPSPAASSRGSTRRAGTLPASLSTKRRWEASGLSCSRRSHPGSSGPPSCSIQTPLPYRLICPHSRRRPGHSKWCQSLRPFTVT